MNYRKLFFLFAGVIALIAVALVGTGISIIEGPATMKLKKADKRRADDFYVIDQAISQYFKDKKRLPTSLEELVASTSRSLSLNDPETATPYPYRVLAERSVEVCANFNLSNVGSENSLYFRGNKSWQHDAGEDCFEIEVKAEKD